MPGTLTISNISDGTNTGSATDMIRGSARAWVNFNGGTATIRASYNVSSITRSTGGDYTVNFTTAMPDANYACTATGFSGNGGAASVGVLVYELGPTNSSFSRTASSVRLASVNASWNVSDAFSANVAIFR